MGVSKNMGEPKKTCFGNHSQPKQDKHLTKHMGVSKNRGGHQIIHLEIGFGTIIFTIHFGGKIPLFLETSI